MHPSVNRIARGWECRREIKMPYYFSFLLYYIFIEVKWSDQLATTSWGGICGVVV